MSKPAAILTCYQWHILLLGLDSYHNQQLLHRRIDAIQTSQTASDPNNNHGSHHHLYLDPRDVFVLRLRLSALALLDHSHKYLYVFMWHRMARQRFYYICMSSYIFNIGPVPEPFASNIDYNWRYVQPYAAIFIILPLIA